MSNERTSVINRLIFSCFLLFFLVSCDFFLRKEAESGLFINEISNTTYYDGSPWIELYNSSDLPVDLNVYTLKTGQVDYVSGETGDIRVWDLPSVSIEAGGYYLIRGNSSDYWTEDGRYVSYISDGTRMPYWGTEGSVELLLDEVTVDYLCFGDSIEVDPVIDAAWTGDPASSLVSESGAIKSSLARNSSSTDTNSATDWAFCEWSTPGGENDISSTLDDDGDGIPDEAEVAGGSWCGYPLYEWGARAGVRDIFIYIIYMVNGSVDSTDPGIIPQKEALDKVTAAFAAHDYAVHFDTGTLFGSDYNLDGTDHSVPYTRSVSLGGGYNDFYTLKGEYVPVPMVTMAHTLLFGSSQLSSGSGGSSGVAEYPGNDFMVTLGGWGLTREASTRYTAEENTQILINYQAATLMHELGHNLGLQHGGRESENYKPNYYSIMNYMYQLDGLPPLESERVGDRYYLYRYYQIDDASDNSLFSSYFPSLALLRDMERGATDANMVIDYSSGNGSVIYESSIDEEQGLYQPGSHSVDYDGDGVSDSSLLMDLNPSETSGTGLLSDYDDWAIIDLYFQNSYLGSLNGVSGRNSSEEIFDPFVDDRQEIVTETLEMPRYLR